MRAVFQAQATSVTLGIRDHTGQRQRDWQPHGGATKARLEHRQIACESLMRTWRRSLLVQRADRALRISRRDSTRDGSLEASRQVAQEPAARYGRRGCRGSRLVPGQPRAFEDERLVQRRHRLFRCRDGQIKRSLGGGIGALPAISADEMNLLNPERCRRKHISS
jgi:hypothetical protein